MTSPSPAAPMVLPASPVPMPTQVAQAVGALIVVVLSSLGITDAALPALVRVEVVPFASLALAVLALAHHQTVQSWHALLQAAVTAGSVALTVTADQGAPALAVPRQPVAVPSAGAVAALVGSALETGRAGVLATAPDPGRHSADDTPTERMPALDVAPGTLSFYPPAVPTTPGA